MSIWFRFDGIDSSLGKALLFFLDKSGNCKYNGGTSNLLNFKLYCAEPTGIGFNHFLHSTSSDALLFHSSGIEKITKNEHQTDVRLFLAVQRICS